VARARWFYSASFHFPLYEVIVTKSYFFRPPLMVRIVFLGFEALLQHESFFHLEKNGRINIQTANKTIVVTNQNCQEVRGIIESPKQL
jgi:hypothetical protein